ncbi:hypothetical protein NDU88_007146 [Pleurodeles waltl]|uniref:Uncharacterized protein n=1 Tax=Pleurodeles waltl TaxID=8319 RepID=A0AAV7WEL4_PLEWA|nr:hypothetical protein NDU88_007146 [Pleurodeles waltl]
MDPGVRGPRSVLGFAWSLESAGQSAHGEFAWEGPERMLPGEAGPWRTRIKVSARSFGPSGRGQRSRRSHRPGANAASERRLLVSGYAFMRLEQRTSGVDRDWSRVCC